jgi:MerR family mercuric resistance operon transcriptional regulator
MTIPNSDRSFQTAPNPQFKIRDIEEKTRMLDRMKGALKRLTAQCRGQGPLSECPILDALEDPPE